MIDAVLAILAGLVFVLFIGGMIEAILTLVVGFVFGVVIGIWQANRASSDAASLAASSQPGDR